MIECIRFKSYTKGCLQGFADIYVKSWGIEIPGFSLYMKDGKRWVNPPGKEFIDKNGEKKFKAFLFFKEKTHWEKFGEAVKDAIDKWCLENQPSVNMEPQSIRSSVNDTGSPSEFTLPTDLPF